MIPNNFIFFLFHCLIMQNTQYNLSRKTYSLTCSLQYNKFCAITQILVMERHMMYLPIFQVISNLMSEFYTDFNGFRFSCNYSTIWPTLKELFTKRKISFILYMCGHHTVCIEKAYTRTLVILDMVLQEDTWNKLVDKVTNEQILEMRRERRSL